MMMKPDLLPGIVELREARNESRSLLWAAGLFSVFVNLLMLTGPLFMLQVYDRVLGSRSEETLVALFVLMGFLFLAMGVLDWARARVLSRMGARFQERLDRRVFSAMLRRAAVSQEDESADSDKLKTGNQLRDLEAVQRFLSSPLFMAIFDIPWTPVFLIGISIFHPILGALAVLGGSTLILVTVLNQMMTRTASVKSAAAAFRSDRYAEHLRTEAEAIRSLGMQENAFENWHRARQQALREGLRASDRSGSFSTISKTFRMFLQSAMLGTGAYFVLQGDITPGVMIASSILLGRALAPVDLVVGQWAGVQRAKRGYDNIVELLAEVRPESSLVELPRPAARLDVQQLTVIPPGSRQASLRLITFQVKPGQAVGVIGPSGSGKSTLARALTGVWRPAGGKIRLDSASLDQYDPERLSQYIGYLPQRVQLFEGTIAENIARLSSDPDDAKVVAAAKKAAAHKMILRLPKGYETPVSVAGAQLSGGQIQRIGLARAIYADPVILVLDEPNSNLDNEGTNALNAAIRQIKDGGGSVLIMAHRPAAIKECEMILMLDDGARKAWGPREKVLPEMVLNYEELQKTATNPAGMT